MKQIKTIFKEMNPEIVYAFEVQDFDNQVNDALAEGWELVKRDIFHPCDTSDYCHPRVLYAELEREIITEAERCCANCRHYDKGAHAEPCISCDDSVSKWEAEDNG